MATEYWTAPADEQRTVKNSGRQRRETATLMHRSWVVDNSARRLWRCSVSKLDLYRLRLRLSGIDTQRQTFKEEVEHRVRQFAPLRLTI